MKRRIASETLLATTLLFAVPAAAQDGSIPTPRRIVMHDVDCTIESGLVCPNDRAMFDEIIASIADDRPIVIRADLADGNGGGSIRCLSSAATHAIRTYLIAYGFAPELVEIQACPPPPSLPAGLGPAHLELQLASVATE